MPNTLSKDDLYVVCSLDSIDCISNSTTILRIMRSFFSFKMLYPIPPDNLCTFACFLD